MGFSPAIRSTNARIGCGVGGRPGVCIRVGPAAAHQTARCVARRLENGRLVRTDDARPGVIFTSDTPPSRLDFQQFNGNARRLRKVFVKMRASASRPHRSPPTVWVAENRVMASDQRLRGQPTSRARSEPAQLDPAPGPAASPSPRSPTTQPDHAAQSSDGAVDGLVEPGLVAELVEQLLRANDDEVSAGQGQPVDRPVRVREPHEGVDGHVVAVSGMFPSSGVGRGCGICSSVCVMCSSGARGTRQCPHAASAARLHKCSKSGSTTAEAAPTAPRSLRRAVGRVHSARPRTAHDEPSETVSVLPEPR